MDELIYKHSNHSWAHEFKIYKNKNGDIIFSVKEHFHEINFAVNPNKIPEIIEILKKAIEEN